MIRVLNKLIILVSLVIWEAALAGDLIILEPGSPGKLTGLDALAKRYNSQQSGSTLIVKKIPEDQMDGFLSRGNPRLQGDLVLIKGLGHGGSAALSGVLEPLSEEVAGIPVGAHLWHPQKLWVGFSSRYRLIYYNSEFYRRNGLLPPQSYQDLSIPELRGKLCLRHGDREYNTTLVSHFFNSMGREATTRLLQGWMSNEPVFTLGDLSGVLEKIHNGECMAGVANSYYFGHFLSGMDLTLDGTPVRASVPVGERGAHINMHGLGILRDSALKGAAADFIRWAFRPNSQASYAAATYMFPVNPEAKRSIFYPSFLGHFFGSGIPQDQTLNAVYVEETRDEVLTLMRATGWKFKDEIEKSLNPGDYIDFREVLKI